MMNEYLVVVDRPCRRCDGTGAMHGQRCPACGGHGRSMLPLAAALQVLYDRGIWPGKASENVEPERAALDVQYLAGEVRSLRETEGRMVEALQVVRETLRRIRPSVQLASVAEQEEVDRAIVMVDALIYPHATDPPAGEPEPDCAECGDSGLGEPDEEGRSPGPCPACNTAEDESE